MSLFSELFFLEKCAHPKESLGKRVSKNIAFRRLFVGSRNTVKIMIHGNIWLLFCNFTRWVTLVTPPSECKKTNLFIFLWNQVTPMMTSLNLNEKAFQTHLFAKIVWNKSKRKQALIYFYSQIPSLDPLECKKSQWIFFDFVRPKGLETSRY